MEKRKMGKMAATYLPIRQESGTAVAQHLGETFDEFHVVAWREIKVATRLGPKRASRIPCRCVHEDTEVPDPFFDRLKN